jgi:transposase
MAADGRGQPLRIILNPGQRGDVTQAPALLEGLTARRVVADKAYDSNALRQVISSAGAEAVIPCTQHASASSPTTSTPTKPETFERCFNKLKHLHRNPIRQARHQLPKLHPSRRRRPHVDAMNVDSAYCRQGTALPASLPARSASTLATSRLAALTQDVVSCLRE